MAGDRREDAGWLVIDMDATLVTASSDKEGAAPTWKKGYGFHPLGVWLANTRECLAMLLRPGNAGSNTFTDHKELLSAALRQVPARFRRKVLVRVDGAGASHDLVNHLLSLSSARKSVLFTCGWMITAADEDAIRQVPAGAWQPGTAQDGTAEDDKNVAEITGLMTRAGNWPGGLRWIVRRVKPSRRHLRNLTGYEKETGWKYSITCTNIPDTGIAGVPGSHHAQYIDTVHREHTVVETAGVRTGKAMGLRNLPSKTWQVNARGGSSPRAEPPEPGRDLGRDLLYRGLRAFPGISSYVRASTHMTVTSRTSASPLLRKPHCKAQPNTQEPSAATCFTADRSLASIASSISRTSGYLAISNFRAKYSGAASNSGRSSAEKVSG